MNIRDALLSMAPSLVLQRAASDVIAAQDARIVLLRRALSTCHDTLLMDSKHCNGKAFRTACGALDATDPLTRPVEASLPPAAPVEPSDVLTS